MTRSVTAKTNYPNKLLHYENVPIKRLALGSNTGDPFFPFRLRFIHDLLYYVYSSTYSQGEVYGNFHNWKPVQSDYFLPALRLTFNRVPGLSPVASSYV